MFRCFISVFAALILLGSAGIVLADTSAEVPGSYARYYWDETSQPNGDPVLVLETSVRGVKSFQNLMSACDMGPGELAYWLGGEPQYYKAYPEGRRTMWRYEGPLDWFRPVVGRMQINENQELTTAWPLAEWPGTNFNFRCIGRMSTEVPVKELPSVTICDLRDAETQIGAQIGAPGRWTRIGANHFEMHPPEGTARKDRAQTLVVPMEGVVLNHTAEGVATKMGDAPVTVEDASLWCNNRPM